MPAGQPALSLPLHSVQVASVQLPLHRVQPKTWLLHAHAFACYCSCAVRAKVDEEGDQGEAEEEGLDIPRALRALVAGGGCMGALLAGRSTGMACWACRCSGIHLLS